MLKNTSWSYWIADNVRTIYFTSDTYIMWVTQSAVIIYDLPNKIGYAAIYNSGTRIFEGEKRSLSVKGNDVYAPDHTTWTWMAEEDKQIMIDLLRRIVSFRQGPFPQAYQWIWTSGVDEVKTLVIQNAGKLKHPTHFIPGLG